MGNFSISHYARLVPQEGHIAVRYVLDMAEIPTVSERSVMDTDGDGVLSDAERTAYAASQGEKLRAGLSLRAEGQSVSLRLESASAAFRPGAGGLETLRIELNLTAPIAATARMRIAYRDDNYPDRTGWKEVVVTDGPGGQVSEATSPATDMSRELTVYPADPTVPPPQRTEAEFTLSRVSGSLFPAAVQTAARSGPETLARSVSRPATPRDPFVEAIKTRRITPGALLLILGIAMLFGALHALSPGHGKTMVAAYLVGERGTPRHAVVLGFVVTLTHTLGVYVLGLIALFAAKYVLPEKIYPILSAGSGLLIFGIGLTMLGQRLRVARRFRRADGASDESVTAAAWEDHEPVALTPPDSSLSFKALVALGISGGLVPCPSAVIVMLSAVALHRTALGLAMITAFSVGLAAVLTGIGLLVVRGRRMLERTPLRSRLSVQLPIVSAALVALVGLLLVVRAVSGRL